MPVSSLLPNFFSSLPVCTCVGAMFGTTIASAEPQRSKSEVARGVRERGSGNPADFVTRSFMSSRAAVRAIGNPHFNLERVNGVPKRI